MRTRPSFTLFELFWAIALAATLLALIGTAVNLYLVRMDTGRTRVEEAQLARSILSTIAADVRATTAYQTQDISTVAQLASQMTPFDPESIGEEGVFQGSLLGTTGAPTTTDPTTSQPTTSGGASLGGSESSTTTMAPGLNGLVNELMLDVARLPRMDELYPAVPQQTSTLATAVAANTSRPSDLKTVRYFIRQ